MSFTTWHCPGCGCLITEDHDIPEAAAEWCSIICKAANRDKHRRQTRDDDHAAAIRELVGALRKYGSHKYGCGDETFPPYHCTCGLDAVVGKYGESDG
jgi:hypothetical protein